MDPATDPARREPASPRLPLRAVQIVLGLIWLADGLLQLQPHMFTTAFLRDDIGSMAQGQPWIIYQTIVEAVRITMPAHAFWNVCFALVQIAIGLGLIVSRRTVRLALILSFAWSLVVWWIGEGLGMLAMNQASPLTGAPGPVSLYALIGILVWPRAGAPDSALVPVWARRLVWALLWLLLAGLMLLPFNSAPDATRYSFAAAAAFLGSGPLAALDTALAGLTAGHGLAISVVSAVLMAAVGLGVPFGGHRIRIWALAVGAAIAVFVFLTTQFLGGLLSGSATDPGSGPLLVLLAALLWERRPRLEEEKTGGRLAALPPATEARP